GFVPVSHKSYPGPYVFGSGLSVTFNSGDLPLDFGAAGSDSLTVTAHSEQSRWANAAPNGLGYYEFDLNFIASASVAATPPYPADMATVSQRVSLDFGAKNPFGAGAWVRDGLSTTQYATRSSVVSNTQNGYPAGSLQRVSVQDNGVVIGIYSNNRQQELYQIALTRFRSPWGLDKKGDNLFGMTRASGEGLTSAPGENGAGAVLGTYLEQSTVDTATEIVNMIFTQRGFQANSKSITTADTMLATAIQLKK
ncbi:MAG: flagellar hook-basal body complex protein, partial [Candidatus Adiutrix sp.]